METNIYQITHYPVDSIVGFVDSNIYQLESELRYFVLFTLSTTRAKPHYSNFDHL